MTKNLGLGRHHCTNHCTRTRATVRNDMKPTPYYIQPIQPRLPQIQCTQTLNGNIQPLPNVIPLTALPATTVISNQTLPYALFMDRASLVLETPNSTSGDRFAKHSYNSISVQDDKPIESP